MPIEARRLLRRMRGGAQAHLLEGDDGRHYVVKFLENPQHRRILVNEWIAAAILRYLGLSAPAAAIISISPAFLADNPDLVIQLGASRRPISPGWHFGSCFPGHPLRQAIYDFIPDSLLSTVFNRRHFLGALLFDKWCSNADSRQAIFFRARVGDWCPDGAEIPTKVAFLTQLIDHGFIANGPHWELPDTPSQGLFHRLHVYSTVTGIDDFEPWLSLIDSFPTDVFDEALRQIPPAWLPGDDRGALEDLLERLYRRRHRVAALIDGVRNLPSNPFPSWGVRAASGPESH